MMTGKRAVIWAVLCAWLGGCGGGTVAPSSMDGASDDGAGEAPLRGVGFISAEFVQALDGVGRLSASALFIEAERQEGDGNVTTIGACTVMQRRVDTLDLDGGFGRGGALDAGAAGTVSNGAVFVELARIAPGNYGAFEDLIGSGFAPTQTLTYRFQGGADIAAFDASIVLPAVLQITAPDLDAPDLSVNTDSPLAVTWVPGTASSMINVTVTAAGPSEVVTIDCVVDDNGNTTVPVEALERLPADRAAVTLSIARTNVRDVMVELTTGGVGVVQVSALTLVSRVVPVP